VSEALSSKYLESLHDPADEPDGVGMLDFEWEKEVTGTSSEKKAKLREMMYEECRVYHSEAPPWSEALAASQGRALLPPRPSSSSNIPPTLEPAPTVTTTDNGGAVSGTIMSS